MMRGRGPYQTREQLEATTDTPVDPQPFKIDLRSLAEIDAMAIAGEAHRAIQVIVSIPHAYYQCSQMEIGDTYYKVLPREAIFEPADYCKQLIDHHSDTTAAIANQNRNHTPLNIPLKDQSTKFTHMNHQRPILPQK